MSNRPTGKKTGPGTSQASRYQRRSRSTSPCGIRACGSPHACPCKRPRKARDGQQQLSTHTTRSWQTSLIQHSFTPSLQDLRVKLNTGLQAASCNKGWEKSVCRQNLFGWVRHDVTLTKSGYRAVKRKSPQNLLAE